MMPAQDVAGVARDTVVAEEHRSEQVGERAVRVKEHEESMYRYRQFWKRCLCYCVREGWLSHEEAGRQHRI